MSVPHAPLRLLCRGAQALERSGPLTQARARPCCSLRPGPCALAPRTAFASLHNVQCPTPVAAMEVPRKTIHSAEPQLVPASETLYTLELNAMPVAQAASRGGGQQVCGNAPDSHGVCLSVLQHDDEATGLRTRGAEPQGPQPTAASAVVRLALGSHGWLPPSVHARMLTSPWARSAPQRSALWRSGRAALQGGEGGGTCQFLPGAPPPHKTARPP